MARAVTREQLWNSTMGPVRSFATPPGFDPRGAFAWDMWRRDTSRNPSFAPATADDEALAFASQKNRLAHDVLMREQARRDKSHIDLLKRAKANQFGVNVFDEPTNEWEANLQAILQEHSDAGARGFTAGMKQDAANQKARLDALLKMQDRQIDRAKLQRDAIESDRDFRRATANDDFRRRYQAGLLQQSAQRQTSDERMANERAYDKDAALALEMVRDFGMDPEEAIRVFNVQGSGQQVLRSIGSLGDEQDAGQRAEVENYADLLNQMELSRRVAMTVPEQPGFFGRLFGRKPTEPGPVDRSQLDPLSNSDLEEMLKMAAREGISYDPRTGFAAPPPPARRATPPTQPQQSPPPRTDIPIARNRAEALALRQRLRSGDRVMVPDGRGGWMIQFVP